jgi:AcrR family transcriptional regulator
MAENRERILAAARRLIARRGVAGMTLRDLASEAGVSVPTVYNLIGGTAQLLEALLAETLSRVATRLAAAPDGHLVDRALALCEAGWTEMLAEPKYFRELVHAFLLNEETAPLRRQMDARNVELMASILRAGRRDGELHEWVDPQATAGLLWCCYIVTMLRWAGGELDEAELPSCVTHGLSTILLGLARGRAHDKLERLVRSAQHKVKPLKGALP